MFHIVVITALLFSGLPAKSFALDHKASSNAKPLFTQLPLIYDPKPSILNPFKMTAISIGWSWKKYPRHITYCCKELFSPFNWKEDMKRFNFNIKTEVPIYNDKLSYGFEVTKLNNSHARFQEISGIDGLVTAKYRFLFYKNLGFFAATLTPQLGLVILDKVIHSGQAYSESGVGIVGGCSVSLDYYFNQWIGIYSEICIKGHGILWIDLDKDYNNKRAAKILKEAVDYRRATTPSPYAYTSLAFSIGVKLTF
jgi:hypothetical protein